MKKLLLMAFAILTVSAFAAEENKETTQNQVENRNVSTVQVQGADVSLGESFMAAFGMAEGGVQGGNSSGNEGGSTSGSTTSGSAAAVGVASAAANAAAVNAANSTTIVTPYGKY